MNELLIYAAGTLVRGAAVYLLAAALIKLLKLRLRSPRAALFWYGALLLTVIPMPSLPAAPKLPPLTAIQTGAPAPAGIYAAPPAHNPADQRIAAPPAEPVTRITPEFVMKSALAIWGAVAFLLLVRMTAAQLYWTRRLNRLPAAADRRLCSVFERLRDGRKLRLLNCDGVFDSPASFGLFRTTVFFPESAAGDFSERELEMMLRHELGHADRHDCLRALLLNAAAAPWWFNPFVAWLRRRIALLREVACDRAALKHLPADNAADYARLLFQYGLKMKNRRFAPGPGLNADFKQTKLRIKEIMMKRHGGFIVSGTALLLTAAAVLMIPGYNSTAQETSVNTDQNTTISPADRKTVEEFIALRQTDPEAAKKQWNNVRDEVMEAGRFDIANNYYGDPLKIYNDFEKSTRSFLDQDGYAKAFHYTRMLRTGKNLIALAEYNGRSDDAAAMRRSLDKFKQEYEKVTNVTLPTEYPKNKTEVRKYYDAMESLVELGRYAEAKPGVIWLWHNMLTFEPAYAAVRGSYLTSDIGIIAEHDPEMKKWAEAIVAEDKKRLLENDFNNLKTGYDVVGTTPEFNLLSDIESLNRDVFKNETATIEFYRELQKKNPAAAEDGWLTVEELVMDAEAFDIASIAIPDPLKAFSFMAYAATERLNLEIEWTNPDLAPYLERMQKQLKQYSKLAEYMKKDDQIPEMQKKFDEFMEAYNQAVKKVKQ